MLSSLTVLAVLATAVSAMDNGLARTPVMGWSSWNAFGGHQSQAIMTSTAEAIIHTGLRGATSEACGTTVRKWVCLTTASPPR